MVQVQHLLQLEVEVVQEVQEVLLHLEVFQVYQLHNQLVVVMVE